VKPPKMERCVQNFNLAPEYRSDINTYVRASCVGHGNFKYRPLKLTRVSRMTRKFHESTVETEKRLTCDKQNEAIGG
jgi:hypothetical protein